ncbi:hypothetical protein ACVWYH_010290 [Bradyrhizobium sp. GM24.11]
MLEAKPAFALTRPKDVFRSLPYDGSAKSIADMEERISAEAKQRHARNRANLIICYLVNDDHAETAQARTHIISELRSAEGRNSSRLRLYCNINAVSSAISSAERHYTADRELLAGCELFVFRGGEFESDNYAHYRI